MSDSQRARELLAAALETAGDALGAEIIRDGESGMYTGPALRAIDQAIADERAAIVKWLRDKSPVRELPYHDARAMAADAIESGEHSK